MSILISKSFIGGKKQLSLLCIGIALFMLLGCAPGGSVLVSRGSNNGVEQLDMEDFDAATVQLLYSDPSDPCQQKLIGQESKINLRGLSPLGHWQLVEKSRPEGFKHLMKQKFCQYTRKLPTLVVDSKCSPKLFDESKNWQIERLGDKLLSLNGGQGYCHKLAAKNVADLFLADYDVPAEFISKWTVDYIRHWWRQEAKPLADAIHLFNTQVTINIAHKKIIEENIKRLEPQVGPVQEHTLEYFVYTSRSFGKKSSRFVAASQLAREKRNLSRINLELRLKAPTKGDFKEDLDHLYLLNISAAALWVQMVKCKGGDAERARRSYFTGRWECDSVSNSLTAKIREGLATQGGHAHNLINFGGLLPVEFKDTPTSEAGALMNLTFLYDDRRAHQRLLVKPARLPATHPLFIQILMEVVVKASKLDKVWSYMQFKNFHDQNGPVGSDKLLMNISGFFNAISQGNCQPIGLWPSANAAVITAVNNRQLEMSMLFNKRWLDVQILDPREIPIHCKQKKLPPIYYREQKAIARQMSKISEAYKPH